MELPVRNLPGSALAAYLRVIDVDPSAHPFVPKLLDENVLADLLPATVREAVITKVCPVPVGPLEAVQDLQQSQNHQLIEILDQILRN